MWLKTARWSVVLSFAILHTGGAQQIATSVAAAESEGASFPHGARPAVVGEAFGRQFGGTAERRCVVPPGNIYAVGGSLRSGEMIVRSGVLEFEANQARKVAWMPLHHPDVYKTKLTIRAMRIGGDSALDSLRLTVPDWVWSGPRTNSGFVNLVTFPAAGTWLVVATAGEDWGCFEFTVATSSQATRRR